MTEYGARCPTCNICFRVTGAQRRATGGLVRCGFCLAPFDANTHSVELTPEPAPATPLWLRPETDWRIEHPVHADQPAPADTTMAPRYDAIASMLASPHPVAPESESESESEPEPEPEPELLSL